ncbi:MAG: hypothetical protein IT289_11470 [Oligoflexia bacterium]|nr:hypothetical protein [Oligoflexia bacterium]
MKKPIDIMSMTEKVKNPNYLYAPYGIANWREMARHRKPAHVFSRPPDIQAFFDRLWPAVDNYVAPLHPIFLLDLPHFATSLTRNVWLIRDGLVPLIWFFISNPEPGNFKAQILIHSQFEEYVPEAWRAQAALFDFLPEESEKILETSAKDRDELLLLGQIMPSVCSLEHLEKDLDMILRKVGGKRGLRKMRLNAFLPARYEDSEHSEGPAFYNKFMITLCRYLGADINILEHKQLLEASHFRTSWVHEFNEKHLYVDSHSMRIALSRGGSILILEEKNKQRTHHYETIYPFYPNLSCGISTRFEKKFIDYLTDGAIIESRESAKNYYSALASSSNRSFPWPRWFTSWCKHLLVAESTPASVSSPEAKISEVSLST